MTTEVRPIEPMKWPQYLQEAMLSGHTISIDRKNWKVCVDTDAMVLYSQEAREFAMALVAAADACDALFLDHGAS